MPEPTEARTRKELIDPALKRAGWSVSDPNRVGLEIPVDGFDPMAWQSLRQKLAEIRSSGGVTYELETPKGVTDYALYRPNGEIMTVVEAKRSSTDPRLAQAQAEFYVSEIAVRQSFAPFAFMTNGERTYFLEDLTGFGNLSGLVKREVQGFFRPMTSRTCSSSAATGCPSPPSPSTRELPTGPTNRRRSAASARRSTGASGGR